MVRAIRLLLADPRDAVLSARMAACLVVVSGLARFTSLPRAQQLISVKVRPGLAADRAVAARLARAIDRVLALDVLVFRRSCWRRAMVLHRYLALHGIESRINFGLQRKTGGGLQGHAWLEHDGQPLLEDDAASYVVTFSLPLHPPAPDATVRLM
jgi:hypothetical protein